MQRAPAAVRPRWFPAQGTSRIHSAHIVSAMQGRCTVIALQSCCLGASPHPCCTGNSSMHFDMDSWSLLVPVPKIACALPFPNIACAHLFRCAHCAFVISNQTQKISWACLAQLHWYCRCKQDDEPSCLLDNVCQGKFCQAEDAQHPKLLTTHVKMMMSSCPCCHIMNSLVYFDSWQQSQ